MLEGARRGFTVRKLPDEEFSSDAITFAAKKQIPSPLWDKQSLASLLVFPAA